MSASDHAGAATEVSNAAIHRALAGAGDQCADNHTMGPRYRLVPRWL